MRATLFFCTMYVATALLAPGVGHGQPASKLEFEVASIKPTGLDQMKLAAQIASGQMPKVGKHVTGARAEYIYMSLTDLIADAYHVKPFQITGPDWLTGQRFDIVAKMPQAASADDARTMLQALLADRFKLAVHRENSEQPVMALVVGKGGPKLKESSADVADIDPEAPLGPGERKIQTGEGEARMTIGKDGTSTVNMGKKGIFKTSMDKTTMSLHFEASVMTMEGFADMLSQFSKMGGGNGRRVVDMTGLKGNYQVAFDIPLAEIMKMARSMGANVPVTTGQDSGAAPADAASDPGASAPQSIQSLGLKLESRKALLEQLIIDRAEKTPTEN